MSEKYAVGEYERRFLLTRVPAEATNPRRIDDLYLDNTRLRLRTVTADGTEPSRKLGHKRRVAEDDPTQIMCTSLYLDGAEFDSLRQLPGRVLTKVRRATEVNGTICSVDEFTGHLAGLILLEVDVHDPTKLAEFAPPAWIGPEVTYDERFTGGELAGGHFAELAGLVDALLANR